MKKITDKIKRNFRRLGAENEERKVSYIELEIAFIYIQSLER